MAGGQQDAPTFPDRWPYNVDSWTQERRWEECYKRLLAHDISHAKICRVWPLFVEYSVRHLEIYLNLVPESMDLVIDDWLAGQGPFGERRKPRTWVHASKDENGVLLDPLRTIKAIPMEGALAALAKNAPPMASRSSCAAKQPTEYAASQGVAGLDESPLPGAVPSSSCSEGSSESQRGNMSPFFSDPGGSPDSTTSTADIAAPVSQHATCSDACSSALPAHVQELAMPCEDVVGGRSCSRGMYSNLTQPTHRRRGVLGIDPV